MNTATKTPDWTKAQIDAIEAKFTSLGRKINNDDCQAMLDLDADQETPLFTDKKIAMLRGKIVSLGYYKAAEKKAVGSSGVVAVRKLAYVDAIAVKCSLAKNSLASFEKASKPQLELLDSALTKMSDQFNAEKIGNPEQVKIKTELVSTLETATGLETGSLKSFLVSDIEALQALVGAF